MIVTWCLDFSSPLSVDVRLAKAKSHIIYSDTDLNTEHVVYLNIYQNFLLSALKMHGYIREWGLTATKNTAFIRSKYSLYYNIFKRLIYGQKRCGK